MKIYIKSGLKSLIFTVPYSLIISLRHDFNNATLYYLKYIGMIFLIYVVPTFVGAVIASFVTNKIITKK